VSARDEESGEDRLIARLFRPIARDPGAHGLLDDAAVFAPPAGRDLVLTADAVIGGVHFFLDDPPGAVACKALRVNLSDLAAKGAQPAGFLLTIAIPQGITDDWLAAFAQGLAEDAERYGCPLLGGDTVRTPGPLMVSIAAFGTLPAGSMVARSGAKAGDRIFVTGTIGDAALGLTLRRQPDAAQNWGLAPPLRAQLADRYLLPQPRNALAEAIRIHASAAIDVSDGLAGDFGKLCRASNVSAEIDVARVPLSESARAVLARAPSLIETILAGGDDYEVAGTLPAAKLASFQSAAKAAGIPLTEIGEVVEGELPPRFLDADGHALRLTRLSFSHF
jgi:thiamine-monophosphate kinase